VIFTAIHCGVLSNVEPDQRNQRVTTVNQQKVTPVPRNGPIGTYFGKLLVIVIKLAKVDGCKPSLIEMLTSCLLCGKNIAAGNKAGKGGIKRHIKGQHPDN
jgi:hypothetical protein